MLDADERVQRLKVFFYNVQPRNVVRKTLQEGVFSLHQWSNYLVWFVGHLSFKTFTIWYFFLRVNPFITISTNFISSFQCSSHRLRFYIKGNTTGGWLKELLLTRASCYNTNSLKNTIKATESQICECLTTHQAAFEARVNKRDI